jgi:hypothetical protein
LLAVLLIPVAPVRSEVVSYECTSFPDSEGWTRSTDCDPERWIRDGWLVQHVEPPSGPCGEPPNGDRDSYSRSLSSFTGADDFFVEWKVETDGDSSEIIGTAPALLTVANGWGVTYHLTIARDEVRYIKGTDLGVLLYLPIQPGVPHVYHVALLADGSYVSYIDHEVIDAGLQDGPFPTSDAEIHFRGKSFFLESTIEWDYVRYGTIPDPGSGDYDGDGLIGPSDFYYFQEYFSGSNEPALPGGAFADFDFDGDIDCTDWDAFQLAWTGPPTLPEFAACDFDPIPAVSDWGVVLMTLLLLTAGTILFRRVPRLSV